MEGNIAQYLVAGDFTSAISALLTCTKLNIAIGVIIIYVLVEGQESIAKILAQRSTDNGVPRRFTDVSLLETALEVRAISKKLGTGASEKVQEICNFIASFKSFSLLTIQNSEVGKLVNGLRKARQEIASEYILKYFPQALKKFDVGVEGITKAGLVTQKMCQNLRGKRTTILELDGIEFLTPSVSVEEGEDEVELVDETDILKERYAQDEVITEIKRMHKMNQNRENAIIMRDLIDHEVTADISDESDSQDGVDLTDGEEELKFSKVRTDHIKYREGDVVESGIMNPDGMPEEIPSVGVDWGIDEKSKLGRRARQRKRLQQQSDWLFVQTKWGNYQIKRIYMRNERLARKMGMIDTLPTNEKSEVASHLNNNDVKHIVEGKLGRQELKETDGSKQADQEMVHGVNQDGSGLFGNDQLDLPGKLGNNAILTSGKKVKLKPTSKPTKNLFGHYHYKWLKDEDGNFYKYVPQSIETCKAVNIALQMLQEGIPWQPDVMNVD